MSKSTVDLDENQSERLGSAVSHRRVAMGYRSARSLARDTGLDYRTITAIESGKPRSVDRNTILALEVGLNWPYGSIDSIINNDEEASVRLTLQAFDDTPEEIIKAAMKVAQAAFDAYVEVNMAAS